MNTSSNQAPQQGNNNLAILSLVFSFLFAPLGLVLGIVALVKKQSKGLAITGIVISSLGLFFFTVIFIAALATTPAKKISDTSEVQISNSNQTDGNTAQQPSEDNDSSVPAEYKSALKQADSYSSRMHMSKKGIYDQLTSQYGGQFSAEAAQYAIDNVKADWNANALAQAKNYQDKMNMSPAAIHDQLTSQYGGQFTVAEADYAIAHLND